MNAAIGDLDWELARHLVAAGANPNSRQAMHHLDMFIMIGNKEGFWEMVRLGTSVDGLYNKYIEDRAPQRVSQLIRFGVPLDSSNATILLYSAAALWRESDTLKRLLELGANPDGHAENTATPLYGSAYYGELDNVKLLVSAGADTASKSFGLTALEVATNMAHSQVVEFLSAIQRREDQVYKAFTAAADYLTEQKGLSADEIINIIGESLQTSPGDLTWNLSVLSVAFRLKQDGFELLTDDVASTLLDGEWTIPRIVLIRRCLSALANMKLRLVQFESFSAPFLLHADMDALEPSKMLSISNEPDVFLTFGIFDHQRVERNEAEGEVGRTLVRAVGIERTISFFKEFYSRRCQNVDILWNIGFDHLRIDQVDQFSNGEEGIIADLLSSSRQLLVQ